MNFGSGHGGELLFGGAFTTGDDGTGVAHALARRGADAGDEADHWFGDVRANVFAGFFFGAAADFTDHDNRFGLRIVLEQFQRVDEGGAWNRVAADTDTGGLAVTQISGLLY